MKKLRVTVDGKIFNVTVEMLDEPVTAVARPAAAPVAAIAPVVAAEPVVQAAPTAVKTAVGADEVCSPLAGKIVSIDVVVGQAVEEGQQVATVEAMKMNTYVFAPKAGKVTAVLAVAGTAVEEGGPLLAIG